jgi:hypothetical protein
MQGRLNPMAKQWLSEIIGLKQQEKITQQKKRMAKAADKVAIA